MDITCKIKVFKELTTTELYEILQLRAEVFVVEQNCIYQDMDGLDLDSTHLFLSNKTDILAYTRVLAPGIVHQKKSSIGRVIVNPKYRRKAFGKRIMEESIQYCLNQYPKAEIKISAQRYLDKFYCDLGFIDINNYYLEDGIPHQAMIYKIDQ